jgi:hypothetical protein
MIAALPKTFRGVLCRWCRKPICVPKRVAERYDDAEGAAGEAHDLVSQTFTLRCRACERESIYSVSQIYDHTPEPV